MNDLIPFGPAVGPALTVPAGLDLLGLLTSGLSPTSAAGYLSDWRDFARFARAPSAEIAVAELLLLEQHQAVAVALKYRADLDTRKLAPATIGRRLAALRRAAKVGRQLGLTAIDLESIESPPARALRDTAGPGNDGWGRMVAMAMAEAATGKPKPVRDLAMVLLLHDRALRRFEVAGLDLADADVSRSMVNILGKGERDRKWESVNVRTARALDAWIRIRGPEHGPLFRPLDRDPANGGKRLSGSAINSVVRALGRRAGVERPTRAHGLRHQAITEALDRGHDVRAVQRFSRHRKIDTVLIYDDNRQDLGGEISRSLETGRKRRRKPA